MSGFTQINLDQLPAPQVVEVVDYEVILAEIKADVISRYKLSGDVSPEEIASLAEALDLESEPICVLAQSTAYREMLLRQRVNDAAKSVMLAHAKGSDLDNLAALFGVRRLIVSEGDANAVPPVPPVYERDDRLRLRAQLSLEAHTTAGSRGSYIFWALSASADVRDVEVFSPQPGHVDVVLLSERNDGEPSADLIARVLDTLDHEDVRPLTDLVDVYGATIETYQIKARLKLFDGPDNVAVLAEARKAIDIYCADQFRLGRDITRSGIFAALHRAGVQNVNLISPEADLVIAQHVAARCTSVELEYGGRDE